MVERTLNDYVEVREGVYFVRGTRIPLDQVVDEYRNGESADAMLDHFPALQSLEKVHGAITFYLANRREIDAYVANHERACADIRDRYTTEHPLPSGLRERLEQARQKLGQRT